MAIAAPWKRREGLPEGVQATAVVVDVEGRIGDDRGEAHACTDAGLPLERAGGRIDVDQSTVRTGNDEAAAREYRSRIVDLAFLGLRLLELRQLRDPADVAVQSINAHKLGFVSDDEDPVACEPRRRDPGEVELPLP